MAEHLRSVAAKHRSGDGKHDVAAESAQLKAAQRRLTELRIKAMEGDLVSAPEALSVWGDFAKDVRATLLSMPSRVAGELPHLVPSELEILKHLARDMLSGAEGTRGSSTEAEGGPMTAYSTTAAHLKREPVRVPRAAARAAPLAMGRRAHRASRGLTSPSRRLPFWPYMVEILDAMADPALSGSRS